MIKVFFLIFEPAAAWERIVQARRGIGFILATYLVPTLLIIAGVETWGLTTMGKWQPRFQTIREFHLPQHLRGVVTFEVVQFFLTLGMVFATALVIKNISGTFRETKNYREAFTAVAYGLSPVFLLRLFDALPMVNPWATWAVGIALTVWILYQGLPRVMLPDPVHAFGLYLSSAIVVVMMSGVVRLLTVLYLLGQVDFHHSWLTHKLPQWLGQ
jgi:hypothetical protein